MSFCQNCGKEIDSNAKFCNECGEPITPTVKKDDMLKRKTVYEGEIHKCPNCGEVLESFITNCSACGYELRGTKVSNSVSEFAIKLEQIEASRENTKSHSVIGKLYGSDGQLSKTDEQKIGLIRSFSIPNNKEDIFEFMILAASNIDTKLYGLGNQGVITASQRAVSDAWWAKFDQAYEKAKITFGNSADFTEIENIYVKTHMRIKKEKMKLPMILGVCIGIPLLIIIVCLILPEPSQETKIEAREIQLENIVDQIEDDIAEGDFADARNKAYTLTFDAELSSERSEYWENKQEEILELIEQASGGEYDNSSDDINTDNPIVEGFNDGVSNGVNNVQENIDEFMDTLGNNVGK